MIDPSNKTDRLLMFLPGFLTWLMLFMPIWLGLIAPKLASYVLTFLVIYWVYMGITYLINVYKGYRRYKNEIKENWFDKCKNLKFRDLPNPKTLPKSLEETNHLILIPTVRESYELLKETFEALVTSTYPISQMIVVIGTEEIGKESVKESLKKIKQDLGGKMPRVLHYIHPKGLPGEIVGVASPNRKWAAEHAVTQLEKEGKDLKNYIFTTFDADWKVHKEFFSALTYHYLTDEKRHNRYYESAINIFSNNFWEVPMLSRIESSNITLGVLANRAMGIHPHESFSCYSSALQTLVDADYWDTTLIDDTVFFWRAFIAREGDFSHKSFYIPIHGDATGGKNYIQAHKNLFKQLVRWGWGSVTTVIAIKAILGQTGSKASLEDKILWVYNKIDRHLFLRTSTMLITIGFSLITFVNIQFKNSATVYGLPQVLSAVLTAGLLMLIPATFIKLKLYGLPTDWPLWKKLLIPFESPFIILHLLTFSFFPYVIAETQLMFGKLPKTTFYTPKTR